MFFNNTKPQASAGLSTSTNATTKPGLINTQPLLGPTATAKVNLGGNTNTGGYNQQAGNQMNTQTQNNSAQNGGWNTQGQFQQAPQSGNMQNSSTPQQGVNNYPSPANQQGNNTPNNYNQKAGQTYPSPPPNSNSKPGQSSSNGINMNEAPNNQYTQQPGNTNLSPTQQNPGLVQQVPGPNQGQGQGPSNSNSTYKPGQPNNNSTAQTSKNPSTHAGNNQPVATRTQGKANGTKKSGPAMAIATNFKASCDVPHRAPYKDKIIVPWDHSKQNYLYNDKDFDKVKPHVTMDHVKTVDLRNSRKSMHCRAIKAGIL